MNTQGTPNLPETKKPRIFYGYLIILAAFCITVISAGTGQTFGIFLKPLLTEFGWTRTMASAAQSIHSLGSGIFSVAAGWLNDRFGPRRVVTVGGFFLGLGFLLTSRINTIWQLYLFYGVVSAIGGASLFVPLMSTVARWFIRRRGLMTGIFLSGMGLGSVIFAPLVSWLIIIYGWRSSYVILGIISMVFIISGAQLLKRDPAERGQLPDGADDVSEEESSLKAGGLSFREAIHTRQFWMLCTINFLFLFAMMSIMTHIVIHATGLGISAISAATILSVIGGTNIAGRLIMGGAADRIGHRRALTVGLILLAASLFWLVVAKELWMLYLFALIFGFGWGSSGVQISPWAAGLFGVRSHGTIFGSAFSGGHVGGALGAVLAGYIFDVTGSYQIAFLTSATLIVITFVLGWLLRPITTEGKSI